MNLKEARDIITAYKNLISDMPSDYSTHPSDLLTVCSKLEALGLEWGDTYSFTDFIIRKGNEYYLANSATNYQFDPDTWYVHWDNGNIGRYQFVDDFGYQYTNDEWNEFIYTLMSYNPVDYDTRNCHIVYDIEHGKKLLKDYVDICLQTQKKMDKKIAKAKINLKYREIEELQDMLEKGEY